MSLCMICAGVWIRSECAAPKHILGSWKSVHLIQARRRRSSSSSNTFLECNGSVHASVWRAQSALFRQKDYEVPSDILCDQLVLSDIPRSSNETRQKRSERVADERPNVGVNLEHTLVRTGCAPQAWSNRLQKSFIHFYSPNAHRQL